MIHKAKRGKKIAGIILTLSVCAMSASGFLIWRDMRTSLEADNVYTRLADRIRTAEDASGENGGFGSAVNGLTEQLINAVYPDAEPAGMQGMDSDAINVVYEPDATDGGETAENGQAVYPDIEIPYMTFDFDSLRDINPDAAAWLYCPDTLIDYPVMRAADYNYYLHHLPDGSYNENGTIFIDYNWKGFSDGLTVLYGHNMKSGQMFGSLANYKKQPYFDEHPYLYLYTPNDGNFRIELLYGCVVSAGQWRERAFMFEENLDAFLTYAAHNTTFNSGASYTRGDRVIALSTCSYEFDDARYVVVGALRPEYGE